VTDDLRAELQDLLRRRSFRFGDFLLSSGRRSDFYFDGKQVTLEGRGLHLASRLILDRCRELEVSAVGGLTLGADPLTAGVIALSGTDPMPLRGFIVRKEAKQHGTARAIEGPSLGPHDRCLLVDDVITSGSGFLTALEQVRATGAEVVEALVLVDREEGGEEALAAAGLPLHALFRRSQFPAPAST
jgi:orotate phosphoribosyltransferase